MKGRVAQQGDDLRSAQVLSQLEMLMLVVSDGAGPKSRYLSHKFMSSTKPIEGGVPPDLPHPSPGTTRSTQATQPEGTNSSH